MDWKQIGGLLFKIVLRTSDDVVPIVFMNDFCRGHYFEPGPPKGAAQTASQNLLKRLFW